MIRHYQVRAFAQEKIFSYINPAFYQPVHFFNQGFRLNNHSVADYAGLPFMKNSGGDDMKNKFFIVYYNGVACIVASLIPRNRIGFFREHINNLSLAFIAPLGANYHYNRHFILFILNFRDSAPLQKGYSASFLSHQADGMSRENQCSLQISPCLLRSPFQNAYGLY